MGTPSVNTFSLDIYKKLNLLLTISNILSIIIIVTITIIKKEVFMATLKYSRQREAIKEYLMHTTSHPTADTVYMAVRKEFPNISLGTVYRNLNLLSEIGDAVKITTPLGGDRFDGNVNPHYHFCCSCCGDVIDLELDEQTEINKIANANFDGIIENHVMMFYGTCSDCLEKKKIS